MAGKGRKKRRPLMIGDARARVFNNEMDLIIRPITKRETDTAFFREFDRIASEIEQNLPNPRSVADDPRRNRWIRKSRKIQPFRRGLLVKKLDGAGQHKARVKRLRNKFNHALTQPDEVECVIDDGKNGLCGLSDDIGAGKGLG